jgi:hypothetical protein
MTHMSGYCRAYLADELRRFPEWHERVPPLVAQPEGAQPGDDESAYFFLHEDFVVTAGVYRDESVAFDQVTDAWRAFCRSVLGFEAPGADPVPAV